MGIGKILYHTVENRNNKDYVEKNAPFMCNRKDAWLGSGYYFWETFVDHAHWWGRQVYHGSYYICKSGYKETQETVLDLHGDMTQLADFNKGYEMLCKESKKDDFTLPEVIEHMKRKLGDKFDFKAIRMASQKCWINNKEIGYHFIPTSSKKEDFISLFPRVQICVFDKDSIWRPMTIFEFAPKSENSSFINFEQETF